MEKTKEDQVASFCLLTLLCHHYDMIKCTIHAVVAFCLCPNFHQSRLLFGLWSAMHACTTEIQIPFLLFASWATSVLPMFACQVNLHSSWWKTQVSLQCV